MPTDAEVIRRQLAVARQQITVHERTVSTLFDENWGLKAELAEAKNEAYRECAKLACWRCAEGMPMSKSGKTHKDKRWGAMPCPAINIRKARPQAFETVAPAEK